VLDWFWLWLLFCDQLWAAVKAKAAADEKSVSEVIVDALKAYIK
jgi:hypothetical protein